MTNIYLTFFRKNVCVYLTFMFFISLTTNTYSQCSNVTNGGTISGDQISCVAFYPNTIVSVAPAFGGTGPIQYQWMYRNASSGWAFEAISGATGLTYNPGVITETTKFKRFAKNQGCGSYIESNEITIDINYFCPCTDTNKYDANCDLDGDGYVNYLDLDDDNDGILDVKEDCSLQLGVYNLETGGFADTSIFLGLNSVCFDEGIGNAWGNQWAKSGLIEDIGFDNGYTLSFSFGSFAHGTLPIDSSLNPAIDFLIGLSEEGTVLSSIGYGGFSTIKYGMWVHAPEYHLNDHKIVIRDNGTLFTYPIPSPGLTVGDDFEIVIDKLNTVKYKYNGLIIYTGTSIVASNEKHFFNFAPTGGNTSPSETTNPTSIGDTYCITNILLTSNDSVCSNNSADSDGVPNSLDLDSDSDGCSDAVEGGSGFTSADIDGNDMLVGNVDTNGVPIQAGNMGQPVGTSKDSLVLDTNCIVCNIDSTNTVISSMFPTTCSPGDNGAITISNIGADVGESYHISYTYSDGANSTVYDRIINVLNSGQLIIDSLVAGAYSNISVELVASTSCNISSISDTSIVINSYVSSLFIANITTNNVDCNGGTDGLATMNISGGVGPYTYLWSDGQTTATASNLSAGNYSVTATDANGCTISDNNVVITEPTVLSSTSSSTNVTGNSVADGSASVTANGGTAPYTYLWSDGQTTATATGLAAGTYTVTVTDANGCTTTETVVVDEPAPLTSSITDVDVLCHGDATGSATVNVSGGVTPYTYSWSNGATTATINGLTAGTYTVTATDANGYTTTSTTTISEPTPLVNAGTTVNNVSCNTGNDGSATVNVSGGNGPYTYAWSNGQTTATATGLATGTYTVTVTDANGCTISDNNVVITEPTTLTSSSSGTDATGNGVADGSASVIANGGTAPYTYLWSDGQTTATATGLAAGTYTVTVTDANGCTTTETVVIDEPAPLVSSITDVDVLCHGDATGSATVNVTGGVMPYTYLWSNGATTATINGLTAGTYTVTVTDANGYTTASTATITEPTVLANTATNISNVSCNGASDGSITLSVTGGVMPYTYLWSNGATTAALTNVASGTYNVTITDANGCVITKTATITEPNSMAITNTTVSDALCFGSSTGSVTVAATGGTLPYTYLWSDGQTTSTATGLAAGTYSVTVTDANGCSVTEGNVVIGQPTALETNAINSSNVTCFNACDGTASILVNGGTMPYTYLWSDGQTGSAATGLCVGTYSVTVTDANGCSMIENGIVITEPTLLANNSNTISHVSCNGLSDGSIQLDITGGTAPYTYAWSNGQTTATALGLSAGTYTVTVTDVNGCSFDMNGSNSIVITEPSPLFNNNTTVNDVSCNGSSDGTITLGILGGTLPYTYLWSDGQTTATASGLSAGSYNVTVTDANGCTIDVNGIVVSEPAVLANNSVNVINVTCNGLSDGSITLNIAGGTIPYTYAWSNGQISASATGLAAGTYSVTITDANGCTLDVNGIAVTEPAPLAIASPTVINASCFGSCDGSISINVTGGTAPYTYDWSQVHINQIDGDGTPTVTNLCKGLYSVLVTDANGCTISLDSIEITEPSPIFESNTTINNVSCNGLSDGSITLDIVGGTAPYTYAWDNGLSGQFISGLSTGTYSVVITDANGCTLDINNIFVGEPLPLANNNTTVNSVSCNSSCDGSIGLAIVGGTMPYSYNWSNGATTASVTGLCVDTYSVVVTDANGCSINVNNIAITEPTSLIAQFTPTNVQCYTACDGAINTTVSGGVMPYTYNWSNGQTTANISNLCNDTYVLTVTDSNGCSLVDSVVITQPEELNVNASSTDVSCYGECDGTGNAIVTGGIMPYNYSWSNGDTLANIDSLCSGSYTITVNDDNNCISSASVVVNEPAQIQIMFSIDYNMGTITATAANGVPNYTYVWDNGTTGPVISNVGNGTYFVTVTDANGCSETKNVTFVEGGGNINMFTVNVAPNPLTTSAMMTVSTTQADHITVELFDASGNVIEETFNGIVQANQAVDLIINGNNLNPGIYLVRILASDGSSISKKLIALQ